MRTLSRGITRGPIVAFVLAFLIAEIIGTMRAQAAYDQGQSTRYSDQAVIFCNSDWQATVTYNNPDHTSATVTATRTADCLFGGRANIWFQMELDHTPPNSSSYLVWYREKNPYTTPGCQNVISCSFTQTETTTQPGFYQLTSWAHFGAYPDGTLWQWPTKGIGWQVKGPPGPFSPAP
jgi:hypothetical protein